MIWTYAPHEYCVTLRGSIFHRLPGAVNDQPIDFNLLAVSGDSAETDTLRYISQSSSNDKIVITTS